MLLFKVFLPVREPLMATFSEKRAATSPKNIARQGIKISKSFTNLDDWWILLVKRVHSLPKII